MEIADINKEEFEILKAIPKKGTFDISDLSGKTLYSPSRVKKTVQKLEAGGVVIRRDIKGNKSDSTDKILSGGSDKVSILQAGVITRDVFMLSNAGEKIKIMVDKATDISGNSI